MQSQEGVAAKLPAALPWPLPGRTRPQPPAYRRPPLPPFTSRRPSAAAALVLALTVAAAPLPAQSLFPDEAAPAAPEATVELEPAAPDTAIEQRILRILEATGWYDGLRVQVDESVAFLDGVTDSEAHRTWAQSLAAKTAGVAAVVNRIVIDDRVAWSLEPAVDELENLAQETMAVLPLVLLALLVLPLAWIGARLVSGLAKWALASRIDQPFLRVVVARAIAFPVFLLGLYIVLQVAGLTQLALSVVGGAGVIGIVIGFAFRDIAENFLSSLILSVQRPFQRGDFIEVAGTMGTVISMNSRSTLLTSVEGNQIHIPNAIVFKNRIENFTASPNRRDDFLVGIGFDAHIPQAQQVILDCLIAHTAVLADPEPMVLVETLGSATVNIRSYYWYDGLEVSNIKLKSALLRAVKSALAEAHISMPDEARERVFPQGLRIIDTAVPTPTGTPSADSVVPEPEVTLAEGDLSSEPPQESGTPPAGNDLLATR